MDPRPSKTVETGAMFENCKNLRFARFPTIRKRKFHFLKSLHSLEKNTHFVLISINTGDHGVDNVL